MVYPAHVIVDFVTVFIIIIIIIIIIHFEVNTLSVLMVIYSTCTIDIFIIYLCFRLRKISVSNQNSKQIPTFSCYTNRLIVSRMHAVSALRIYMYMYVSSDTRYFCFFHLCYAILSSESQREYFYTIDLFIECSRSVYI